MKWQEMKLGVVYAGDVLTGDANSPKVERVVGHLKVGDQHKFECLIPGHSRWFWTRNLVNIKACKITEA